MSLRDEKKAKFNSPAAKKDNKALYAVLSVIVVAILATGGFLLKGKTSTDASGYVDASQAGETATPASIDAVAVEVSVSGGQVVVPMKALNDTGFIEFTYVKGTKEVPLLAYKTADGVVTTAVRMCEPCSSKSFHIEGDEIVCNACGTRWKTKDLSGVSGGCLTYPPERLDAEQKDGNLLIPESDVSNWKPRV